MGDYYLVDKVKSKAILNFEKALKWKENPVIRKKLSRLKDN
jgi:hypothetical protein